MAGSILSLQWRFESWRQTIQLRMDGQCYGKAKAQSPMAQCSVWVILLVNIIAFTWELLNGRRWGEKAKTWNWKKGTNPSRHVFLGVKDLRNLISSRSCLRSSDHSGLYQYWNKHLHLLLTFKYTTNVTTETTFRCPWYVSLKGGMKIATWWLFCVY